MFIECAVGKVLVVEGHNGERQMELLPSWEFLNTTKCFGENKADKG